MAKVAKSCQETWVQKRVTKERVQIFHFKIFKIK